MRRAGLLVVWVLELWLVLLLALAALVWIWSGSEGSLAQALPWATRFLPGGQQLVAEDVRGSVRAGRPLATISRIPPSLIRPLVANDGEIVGWKNTAAARSKAAARASGAWSCKRRSRFSQTSAVDAAMPRLWEGRARLGGEAPRCPGGLIR